MSSSEHAQQGLASERGLAARTVCQHSGTNASLRKIALYGSVSVAALVPDIGLFAALTGLTATPSYIAGAVSYLCGAVVHYLLATRFVFSVAQTRKGHRRLVTEYLATGLVGVCITAATIYPLVHWLNMPPLAAKAVGVLTSFVTVYVLRASIVFKDRENSHAKTATLPLALAHRVRMLRDVAKNMRTASGGSAAPTQQDQRRAG